jgi:5-formaminoimidazole-4-carboxamide-1-beta-D-ribofuranosyl 5'-monophosphate synthetase
MRVGSVACVASHSALDVFDGAKDEGFRTVAVCRRGRDAIYKALPELIDHYVDLDDYREMLSEPVQRRLLELESVVVPNRSMAVYVGYEGIERSLRVPFFGNRMMLRWEERTGEKNYYRLLDEAGVSRPKTFSGIEEVDRPVVLKVQEAERTQERAFIVATDRDDLRRKVRRALEAGTISEATLRSAVIEELLLGAHFNVNFFLSRVRRRLEIVSVDRRVQSDLDGYLRLPAREQLELGREPSMIEVGHDTCYVEGESPQPDLRDGEEGSGGFGEARATGADRALHAPADGSARPEVGGLRLRAPDRRGHQRPHGHRRELLEALPEEGGLDGEEDLHRAEGGTGAGDARRGPDLKRLRGEEGHR